MRQRIWNNVYSMISVFCFCFFFNLSFNNKCLENFLAVQSLKSHAHTAGIVNSIPSRGPKIPYVLWHSQNEKKKKKETNTHKKKYLLIDICIMKLYYILHMHTIWNSLVVQMIKNLPAMQETPIWSLGQDDPLEKGMATHSSILAWRIPWTEEPGRLQSMGSQRVGLYWATNTHTYYIHI